jgi:hypothetical protein
VTDAEVVVMTEEVATPDDVLLTGAALEIGEVVDAAIELATEDILLVGSATAMQAHALESRASREAFWLVLQALAA